MNRPTQQRTPRTIADVLRDRLEDLEKWYTRGFIDPTEYERDRTKLVGEIWLEEHAE